MLTNWKIVLLLLPILLIENVPPTIGADLQGDQQAFLGSWEGTLRNGRPAWLIVEDITSGGDAMVVYKLAKWGRFRSVDQRQIGTIKEGTLQFTLNNGAELKYILRPDNSLRVFWRRGERRGQWTMTKAAGEPQKTTGLADCDAPLPDVIIIPPNTEVPQKFAEFSGVWTGRWTIGRCSRLAIDLVEPSGKVRYVYAFSKFRRSKGGYRSGYGQIRDGKLEFGRSVKFTFWVHEDGTMRGEFQSGRTSEIIMKKISVN